MTWILAAGALVVLGLIIALTTTLIQRKRRPE